MLESILLSADHRFDMMTFFLKKLSHLAEIINVLAQTACILYGGSAAYQCQTSLDSDCPSHSNTVFLKKFPNLYLPLVRMTLLILVTYGVSNVGKASQNKTWRLPKGNLNPLAFEPTYRSVSFLDVILTINSELINVHVDSQPLRTLPCFCIVKPSCLRLRVSQRYDG